MNTGVTREQLDQLCQTLMLGVEDQTGKRAASALHKHLAATANASG